MEGLEQGDGINMETVTSMQTQKAWQVDGVRYCPDMRNIVLPSYFPIMYKPGYSGGGGRVEHIQLKKQQYQAFLSCKDGPRRTDTHLTKTGLEVQDGSPSEISTRTAHPAIQITVKSVQLYGAVSAHPEVQGGF